MSAHIAIDAMSGDFGPHLLIPACLAALAEDRHLSLTLVGDSTQLTRLLSQHNDWDRARLHIKHASEVIEMADKPSTALRSKPDSSMRVALQMLRDHEVQACVSAGNTGALMALARFILKTLPGIDRPAMMTAIPTVSGECQLLDLGANVDCSAEHLLQFAVMGSLAAACLGVERPRVALLNIGSEAIKGNQQVKFAASLLEQAEQLNYTGFIEGDGVFRGEADVVVCDGFVGNVLLKSSEGLAGFIVERIRNAFSSTLFARLVGWLALPFLKRLQQELSPAAHNGASFLGLQGVVVKSHGGADTAAFLSAIRRARMAVEENLPQKLHGHLEDMLL
ncbi:phosphate acyltransferase PlsX [Atopomonas sediminilitoris]|uniref:phosphate acyltransferase PlsX n=1 Tax=Atopomonas sediminilitoris TaxID=2919919 RepID=UPI001F4E1A92|nr:phosphate acyltransferase PlsX [Atopomonas sediminilitoris]MCJ8167792.1 phosphate acyltransferase PlsX [Atopomonas sediminilitoris]